MSSTNAETNRGGPLPPNAVLVAGQTVTGKLVAVTVNADGELVTTAGGSGGGGTDSAFGATFPTDGTAIGFKDSAGANMAPGNLDASGYLKVNVAAGGVSSPVSTVTLANVSSSASSVTLQASNANRKGWSVFNDSAAVLYVKFGATASATSFTVKMAAGAYYEMPSGVTYTGVIDGIWASADGAARVMEL